MNTELTFPVSNLHGTGAQRLQDDYVKAMDAVHQAQMAFCSIEFHARDYASMEDFQKAKHERNRMYTELVNVYMYLTDIAESLNK